MPRPAGGSVGPSERSPLLNYRLCSSVSVEAEPSAARAAGARKLPTFLGVVVPTLLSMFSVVLFLRLGFVVGQAGLFQSLAMFVVAYFIIGLTVLSVCAISTNGALDAGGAYYMISRALGPEFGGSIGIMFFLANVCASALYILGLVEAVVDDFGAPAEGGLGSSTQVLPRGYWFDLLYGTVLLFLCLLVCLVGAGIYAKATFLIFLIVMLVLGTVCLSFFVVAPRKVKLPPGIDGNGTEPGNASFTGFKHSTLQANLFADYSVDYTTGRLMSFSTVFAVMFNGCTGIMAGSNMSGDLRRPSYSIPRGTITAVIFTYIVYNLLAFLLSCTCDRLLLQRDYSFLRDINIWPPFVIIGVYCSTLSAAMSNLIGASRILYALAKDDLFGKVLGPAKRTSRDGNPWMAVIFSWILVQLVLFSGKLNTIAAVVTIFFLLVYATVDLACLALEWASAPNFRPTFRYFTWHTCVLGIGGCFVMVFLISPIYASASVAFMVVLLVALHYLSPSSSWGYISQALIFHQVRKYLLMLDIRKEHVKFWRPQVLLMVRNPRTSLQLISFINDLKKSGLYVLGHVELDDLDSLPSDPLPHQSDSWLQLVDRLNIKAFVNLTLSDSIRHGTQQLLFISGLGGMRPNTIALGFYDDATSQDCLSQHPAFSSGEEVAWQNFPPPWTPGTPKRLSPWEYVAIIADALKMQRNVLLARSFEELKPPQELGWRAQPLIDVWPINLLRPDSAHYVNTCSLFLLQMACVLAMARAWRRARLRLFLCMESGARPRGQEDKLRQLLKDLRIQADIHTVLWDGAVALHWHRQQEVAGDTDGLGFPGNAARVTDEYLGAVNQLILQQSSAPTVRFLYLPHPPADTSLYGRYLEQLEVLTRGLGPTLLVHGVSAVTSTEL
ncbi:solute carrier family 12 member 9 isoform X2 [Zootoca vivipara]|uniref:solute carrier family 12 member 9 isoform X2 n=1 Tax=Zootoca vivipara TaxID=8524 RepID=UPI0015922A07|nr:solute carrier family 12 member 9 isoform X2 [Zootoca vivipara]